MLLKCIGYNIIYSGEVKCVYAYEFTNLIYMYNHLIHTLLSQTYTHPHLLICNYITYTYICIYIYIHIYTNIYHNYFYCLFEHIYKYIYLFILISFNINEEISVYMKICGCALVCQYVYICIV